MERIGTIYKTAIEQRAMRKYISLLLSVVLIVSLSACRRHSKFDPSKDTMIRMETTAGVIVFKLYKDTPKHRANFIKIMDEGIIDRTLFHRVIKDFMIQGGDPDSKDAPPGKELGTGGPRYTVPAEIRFPAHFHKRGALAAARADDSVNPMKESSSCQFFIVTGKVYSLDSLMTYQDMRNKYIENQALEGLAQKHIREINQMKKNGDNRGLFLLQQKLLPQAKMMALKEGIIKYSPEQIETYTTIGGAPLLDGNYTVFGEVVSGMEVIDKIANMPTDRNDRPLKDVKILKVEVLNEN